MPFLDVVFPYPLQNQTTKAKRFSAEISNAHPTALCKELCLCNNSSANTTVPNRTTREVTAHHPPNRIGYRLSGFSLSKASRLIDFCRYTQTYSRRWLQARQVHHFFNHPMHGSDKLRIGGSIEDFFPHSTRSYKSGNLQKPQMVRYGGAAHLHDGSNVEHALFGMAQQQKNPTAGRIA